MVPPAKTAKTPIRAASKTQLFERKESRQSGRREEVAGGIC